jgi:hypothetical protein
VTGEYYYLVSTLPLLCLDDPPPLTSEAFLELCRAHVDEAGFRRLRAVDLIPDGEPGGAVDRGWRAWETYVRNLLATLRGGALRRETGDSLRPEIDVFPGDRRRLEEIMNEDDPAARERALDELRWRRLDDLAVGHHFDVEALVVYRLRLRIMEKWAARESERGKDNLTQLVDAGVDQAEKRRHTTEAQTL